MHRNTITLSLVAGLITSLILAATAAARTYDPPDAGVEGIEVAACPSTSPSTTVDAASCNTITPGILEGLGQQPFPWPPLEDTPFGSAFDGSTGLSPAATLPGLLAASQPLRRTGHQEQL